MKKITNHYYEIEQKGCFAILFFKNDIFKLLTSGNEIEILFETLKSIKRDSNIKALLFMNSQDCYGEKVYDTFIKEIMSPKTKNDNTYDIPNFCDQKARFKELNFLNRFVSFIAGFNKICVTILSGSVVTPFFGAALATDIRFATEDTFFSLAHHKYGLHPSGGLPYFLVEELGYNKAMKVLLTEKISSKEAYDIGLINNILPKENTLEHALKHLEKIKEFNSCSLRRTKSLLQFTRKSLAEYFLHEGTFMYM